MRTPTARQIEKHAPSTAAASAAEQSSLENSIEEHSWWSTQSGRTNMFEWDDRSLARLRQLWEEGLSAAKIGREIGTTKNAVVGKAHRLRLSASPSAVVRKTESLDAAQTEVARAMWHDRTDLRIEDIARILGVTVNVLRGKAFRMSWAPRGMPVSRRGETVKTITVLAPTTDTPEPFLLPPPVAVPTFKPRPPGACCWPMWGHGSAPSHQFCDAPSVVGRPYCPEHASIAYSRTVPSGERFQLRAVV